MNRKDWASVFAKFPPGLSGADVARRIKQPPQLTQYWIKRLKYQSVDGRKCPLPAKFASIRKVNTGDIDWAETNNQIIASRHGVSRQRIWQLRKRITKV